MKKLTSLYLIVCGVCLLMVSCVTQKRGKGNGSVSRPMVERYKNIRIDRSYLPDSYEVTGMFPFCHEIPKTSWPVPQVCFASTSLIDCGRFSIEFDTLYFEKFRWQCDTMTIVFPSEIPPKYILYLTENNGCGAWAGNDTIVLKDKIVKNSGRPKLGLSYFSTMKRHETKDIRIFVRQGKKACLVYNELRKVERETLQLIKNSDTSLIYEMDIDPWKSLHISLLFDKSNFEVNPIATEEIQKLDKKNGNFWHWKIKAISEHPEALVTLIVEAIDLHDKKNSFTREVPIKIVPDLLLSWQKLIIIILENPSFTIPTIVAPIIGGIVAVKFRRKKKKKKKVEVNKVDPDIY